MPLTRVTSSGIQNLAVGSAQLASSFSITGNANVGNVGANNGVFTTITGSWNGSTVPVNKGGTGQTTYTNGQLLIGNTTSSGLDKTTLTAGNGISITNGSGTITITNSSTGGAQDFIVQSYGIT